MACDGGNHRNRKCLLGLADESQILGKDLLADVSGQIVISLRMNIGVIGGNLHCNALLKKRLQNHSSRACLLIFHKVGY